jgi:hypothetical protein
MSSSSVEWSCSTCRVALDKRQRTHPPCHTHTTWTCLLTQRSGTHDTYKHHAQHCEYCSPEQKEAIREENEANKENRIAAVEEDEKGQSAVHHRSHILLPPAVNTYRHDDLSHADFSLDSPQWPWKEWGADEVAFIQMTGLNLTDLAWVYQRCKEGLMSLRLQMQQKHENLPPWSPHNMLCITIHWLRKYPSYNDMVVTFNRSRHYLYNVLRSTIHVLDSHIFTELVRPLDTTSPISTRSTLPHVKIVVDTTFIPLPKTPFQPNLYHPKSPTKAAWKFEVGCDLSHRIISVSKVYRGPTDDRRILSESGLLQQSSDTSRIIGDKGYIGQLGVMTPARRGKKRNLELARLEDERTKRHELESERAAIENINERLKQWHIISDAYRGQYPNTDLIDPIVRVVCALTNLILVKHPIRKGS